MKKFEFPFLLTTPVLGIGVNSLRAQSYTIDCGDSVIRQRQFFLYQ
jgi:hypothetical protein